MNKIDNNYERGDVLLVSLSPTIGSEQANVRPTIVVSNEVFHKLNIVTVVALTSRNLEFPGRVTINPDEGNGLQEASDVLTFQIRTVSTDKSRIIKKRGRISKIDMNNIDEALMVSLKLF